MHVALDMLFSPRLARIALFVLSFSTGLTDWIQAGPGSLDRGFAVGTGAEDGPVLTLCPQSNGDVLVGGFFSRVDGNYQSATARLHAGGGLDYTFHVPGLGGHLHAILALPDGKILIGGEFDHVGETTRYDLARLNPDGSLDSTFDASARADLTTQFHVDALVRQSNGKILLTGDFLTFNGTAHRGVARLLPDGSVDSTFNAGEGLIGHLPALVVDGAGRVLVGGSFTNSQGAPRYGITRLNPDGSLDPSFQPTPGAEDPLVSALAVDRHGKILVGGRFVRMNGQPCNRLARLNADGSLDPGFDAGSGIEGDDRAAVDALALQDDGKILVGGLFEKVNGQPCHGLARLNPDGSLDTTFASGQGVNDRIKVLSILPDGRAVAGGYFTQFDGVPVGHLARVTGDFWPAKTTPIRLRVDPAPCVKGFPFQIPANIGCSYTVEFSEDSFQWKTLTNFIGTATNAVVLDPGSISHRQRFYRIATPR